MRTRPSGGGGIALGLLAGCATFFGGDALIDRLGGAERNIERCGGVGLALAILLGIVLDGIPESIVLGLTSSRAARSALPSSRPSGCRTFRRPSPPRPDSRPALGASPDSRRLVVVMLVSGLAALAGYGLFDGASPSTVAFVNAFAAGAILTMLADTMMPEAFQHGGKLVASSRRSGLRSRSALSTLE